MPHPKFMVMVSFCWKMNFLPGKIKKKSVLLTISLKLMIEVVAFFLGHPVYDTFSIFGGASDTYMPVVHPFPHMVLEAGFSCLVGLCLINFRIFYEFPGLGG